MPSLPAAPPLVHHTIRAHVLKTDVPQPAHHRPRSLPAHDTPDVRSDSAVLARKRCAQIGGGGGRYQRSARYARVPAQSLTRNPAVRCPRSSTPPTPRTIRRRTSVSLADVAAAELEEGRRNGRRETGRWRTTQQRRRSAASVPAASVSLADVAAADLEEGRKSGRRETGDGALAYDAAAPPLPPPLLPPPRSSAAAAHCYFRFPAADCAELRATQRTAPSQESSPPPREPPCRAPPAASAPAPAATYARYVLRPRRRRPSDCSLRESGREQRLRKALPPPHGARNAPCRRRRRTSPVPPAAPSAPYSDCSLRESGRSNAFARLFRRRMTPCRRRRRRASPVPPAAASAPYARYLSTRRRLLICTNECQSYFAAAGPRAESPSALSQRALPPPPPPREPRAAREVPSANPRVGFRARLRVATWRAFGAPVPVLAPPRAPQVHWQRRRATDTGAFSVPAPLRATTRGPSADSSGPASARRTPASAWLPRMPHSRTAPQNPALARGADADADSRAGSARTPNPREHKGRARGMKHSTKACSRPRPPPTCSDHVDRELAR
ncbi:hypothetical protein B0H15DRAFT_988238 [Mycena belliarum]|uniref:Uncharacterized protein n=1 Tax=Mycena belliarum TaxID=1033014 RepID=A0AAD6XQE4_9AGAR|nr:hypothetical protein B0H15DRAFT_988238 [Mycena belliae]